MSRYAALVLFLSFGIVSKLSHGIEVNVTKDEKLCLYANLMLNFSVSYEVKDNKTETVKFELPDDASASASKCDSTASTLTLRFGEGHSWSVDFSLNGKIYQADRMTFTYNLSDSTVFPNSLLNGTYNVTVKPEITNVGLDTCYSCKSKDTIEAATVNMTLWNVLMQAFVVNGSKSVTLTSCPADHMTTVSPTTHVTSTTPVVPVTNTTTSAPTTTTTPAPTLPPPTTGNYTLKPDDNSTACLLARFGLRVGFEQGGKYQEMNLDPNVTKATGICGLESSELVLVSSAMTVHFTFTNDTKKFRLHALNVTANTSSGVFSAANTNLSLWEAALSSSYMCNKEQNYTITSLLSLYVFNLQVQPFGVKKGVFSTAHECSLDDTSILIPIIVGAALAGLILIVVIAYVIGRRKTYVGYQTL